MSDLASSSCVAAPSSDIASAADQLKKELADRLVALIDNAEARVRALQNKAASEFTRRQERLAQFAATRTRVNRIINDRLGVLMSQSQFSDAQLTYSDGRRMHRGSEVQWQYDHGHFSDVRGATKANGVFVRCLSRQ